MNKPDWLAWQGWRRELHGLAVVFLAAWAGAMLMLVCVRMGWVE